MHPLVYHDRIIGYKDRNECFTLNKKDFSLLTSLINATTMYNHQEPSQGQNDLILPFWI